MHIRRLRSKLGPEFEAIIGTVRNVGYRFTLGASGKLNGGTSGSGLEVFAESEERF